MKACNECHVTVAGQSREFCPLCGAPLAPEPLSDKAPLPQNTYPDLSGMAAQYNFVKRLLIFFSLLSSGVSLLVNLLVPIGFLWSLIVIAAILYLWLSVPPLLSRGVNYAKHIVLQTLFTSLLVVALDIITGYNGWSVSFVVPALFCGGIVAIGLMVVFNRTSWVQYVLYQVLMAVFGFVPLVLWLVGLANNIVMVILSAAMGLASLLITIIFGDRSIKSEFKRRFHF